MDCTHKGKITYYDCYNNHAYTTENVKNLVKAPPVNKPLN